MAVPTFVFNSSLGSNTQASGAGPATAVFGTNASFSGSVVTLDGSPDLSGVATDGSHVLWLLTSTGAQFLTINAKDDGADTVTTDVAPAGTSTGLTWAIGGKRATFDETSSRNLFNTSILDGWVVITETDQSLTAGFGIAAQGDATVGPMVIKGDSESTLRVITQTINAPCFSFTNSAVARVENLKFQNTNGTKTAANGLSLGTSGTGVFLVANCIIGDATNTLNLGITFSAGLVLTVLDTTIRSCSSHGINFGGTSTVLNVVNCDIHNNGGRGITSSGSAFHRVARSLIWGNTGDGFIRTGTATYNTACYLTGNVIHGNGGDGIDLADVGNLTCGARIYGNNITANGGYGINATGSLNDVVKQFIDYNNFGTSGGTANTSGALNNISAGPHDLAVDPLYVNAAGGNFACGTPIKAEGYPDSTRTMGADQGGTTPYVDIGVQRQEAGGGGGPIFGGMVVR